MIRFDQDLAIREIGKRLKCTHIHNNFYKDDHLPPDSGNINRIEVMKAFKDIEFEGPLTLETHCRYNEDELLKSFLKHNYNCLCFFERM